MNNRKINILFSPEKRLLGQMRARCEWSMGHVKPTDQESETPDIFFHLILIIFWFGLTRVYS